MKRIILLITAIFCYLNLTYAQPGKLDSSFGTMGTIEYDGGHLTCIAIQSDDKVVVARIYIKRKYRGHFCCPL